MKSKIKTIISSIVKEEISNFIIENRDEYHGEHEAPTKDDSPMWDVTLKGTFPEDFYSSSGARMYATSEEGSFYCYGIVRSAYKKPNKRVKIYRAIPAPQKTNEEIKIDLENQLKYMLKFGKIPPKPESGWPAGEKGKKKSEYYDFVHSKLDNMKDLPPSAPKPKISFNSGDWVTIYKPYALEHARALGRNISYKIISKTVTAKELYTDGNSLLEWGWNP